MFLLCAGIFSLAGLINGILAQHFDDISIIPSFVLQPLTYLGGVFYSISLLPELAQQLSKLNPILYIVNAFRYGMLGVSDIDIGAAFAMMLVSLVGAVCRLPRAAGAGHADSRLGPGLHRQRHGTGSAMHTDRRAEFGDVDGFHGREMREALPAQLLGEQRRRCMRDQQTYALICATRGPLHVAQRRFQQSLDPVTAAQPEPTHAHTASVQSKHEAQRQPFAQPAPGWRDPSAAQRMTEVRNQRRRYGCFQSRDGQLP